MPYELKPNADETVLIDIDLRVSPKEEPFRFAVTDRTHYVPATRFVVSGDSRFFDPIPNAEIQVVEVHRLRPYGSWVMAALMLVFGSGLLALSISWMMQGTPFPARALGWALAAITGGVLLPVVAKGRYGLKVVAGKRTFQWSPPLVVDKASKRQITATLDGILTASSRAGVVTDDARMNDSVKKAA